MERRDGTATSQPDAVIRSSSTSSNSHVSNGSGGGGGEQFNQAIDIASVANRHKANTSNVPAVVASIEHQQRQPSSQAQFEALTHKRTVSWGDSGGIAAIQQAQQQQQQQPLATNNNHRPHRLSPRLPPSSLPTKAAGPMPIQLTSTTAASSTTTNPTDFARLLQPKLSHSPTNSNNNNPMDASLGTTVTLDDVLKASPLESEAETNILSAMEQQFQQNQLLESSKQHMRQGTGMSLLSAISDDAAVEVFLPTLAAGAVVTESADKSTTPNAPPRLRTKSQDPHQSDVNSVTSQHRETNAPSMLHHQRTQTMEQTLFGLTSALANLHYEQQQHDNEHEDKVSYDPAPPVPSAATGSTDTLLRNANLIYRGGTSMRKVAMTAGRGDGAAATSSTATPATGASHKTGKSNWRLLRTTVQIAGAATSLGTHPKKVDKDDRNNNEASIMAVAPRLCDPPLGATTDGSHHSTRVHAMADNADVESGGVCFVGTGTDGSGRSYDNNFDNNNDDSCNDLGNSLSKKDRHGPKQVVMDSKARLKKSLMKQARVADDFRAFVGETRNSAYVYLRYLVFLVVPAIGVASILFYVAGNPPTGRIDTEATQNRTDGWNVNTDGELINPDTASSSWWILFICVRQAITFSMARALQFVVIDFFCLSSRMAVHMLGDLVTLLIVQSKGWPFTVFMWCMLDFALLSGSTHFASNWLYWQETIDIFNESNPSGGIPSSNWNHRILAIGVSVGLLTSAKRLWLGLFLGRKIFAHYANDLAKVMKRIILLCEVAALSRTPINDLTKSVSRRNFAYMVDEEAEVGSDMESRAGPNSPKHAPSTVEDQRPSFSGLIIDEERDKTMGGKGLNQSQRHRVVEFLGHWEEPEKDHGDQENITISAILQFRQSLRYMENRFMFSIGWGDVSSRERMVVSSQEVYRRLTSRQFDSDVLSFETLATIALTPDGTIDQDKMKSLIRLLRPDRDGNLTLLDFVKSVDSVYKEARLLSASVKNSEKIDRAFEKVMNIFFYTIMTFVILSQIGFNAMALFLSLSSIILGFAFMIGSASSKMFEGWLFILVQRPYDIGDRVNIANNQSTSSSDGSQGWIIKDVSLFSTAAVLGATGENATFSNGSLASSRVINMARSPMGTVYIQLKFPIDTEYDRIKIFETALREFVKSRPREWANFVGFRVLNIAADLGYVEYTTIIQHRESWQSIGAILVSKGEVASYCLELTKKLNMRYRSPPMPVDLSVVNRSGMEDLSLVSKVEGFEAGTIDVSEVARMFDKKV